MKDREVRRSSKTPTKSGPVPSKARNDPVKQKAGPLEGKATKNLYQKLNKGKEL